MPARYSVYGHSYLDHTMLRIMHGQACIQCVHWEVNQILGAHKGTMPYHSNFVWLLILPSFVGVCVCLCVCAKCRFRLHIGLVWAWKRQTTQALNICMLPTTALARSTGSLLPAFFQHSKNKWHILEAHITCNSATSFGGKR